VTSEFGKNVTRKGRVNFVAKAKTESEDESRGTGLKVLSKGDYEAQSHHLVKGESQRLLRWS
jgi:hypothetical protein